MVGFSSRWIPLSQGLVTDPKHRERMGQSIWLYLYLLARVDGRSGQAVLTYDTIKKDAEIAPRTAQRYLGILTKHGYVEVTHLAKSMVITVTKFKGFGRVANSGEAGGSNGHKQNGYPSSPANCGEGAQRVARCGEGEGGEGRHILQTGSPDVARLAKNGEAPTSQKQREKPPRVARCGDPPKDKNIYIKNKYISPTGISNARDVERWEKIIFEIQKKILPSNFDAYVRPLKFHGVHGDELHVQVPHGYPYTILRENYRDMIHALVQEFFEQPIQIKLKWPEQNGKPNQCAPPNTRSNAC